MGLHEEDEHSFDFDQAGLDMSSLGPSDQKSLEQHEAQVESLRAALRAAQGEMRRLEAEAENRRHLVDIMHDVMAELSTEEIFHMVARRLAKAFNLVHSSVILASFGDDYGVVASAFERPQDESTEIRLEQFPEVLEALTEMQPVVIEDISKSPLYDQVRATGELDADNSRVRSVIAIPFTFEQTRTGVFLLRRADHLEPLNSEDVEFVDTVIRSAVNAIERSQAIEQARADNARLEALAHTDPLTLLLNRRALTVRTITELDRVRRYNSPLTMLMVDLDHFKQINDTYGHLVGDDVLRGISTILQNSVRTVDMVARFGGEEFVIVMPETDERGAVRFAERIRKRVEDYKFIASDGARIPVTVSIGVAIFPAPYVDTIDDLFARADAAMYQAKASGRNRVCL